MPPYVTTGFSELAVGARGNLSVSLLSVVEARVEHWHHFANELETDLRGFWTTPLNSAQLGIKPFFNQAREAILQSTRTEDVCEILDGMLCKVAHARERTDKRIRTGVRYMLAKARYSGLVLLPVGCLFPGLVPWLGTGCYRDPPLDTRYGDLRQKMDELAVKYNINENDRRFDFRSVANRFFLSFDVPSFISLRDESYRDFWLFAESQLLPLLPRTKSKQRPTIYSRTQGLLNRMFEFACLIEAESEISKGPPPRFNSVHWQRELKADKSLIATTFTWWVNDRPEFANWAQLFSWYLHSKLLKRPVSGVSNIKLFCNYLALLNSPPPSPESVTRSHFIRRDDSPELTFFEYLDKTGYAPRQIGYQSILLMRDFFGRWHDEYGKPNDLWENPIREYDLSSGWNKGTSSGKTNKEILPVRIIKLMKDVIVENDFAWPKSLGEDYFKCYSPDGGSYNEVWSPVRSIALLFLLTVPIRAIQLRLLDSGEGDEFWVNDDNVSVARNASPFAEQGRQEGVLQRIYDSTTQRYFTGLHITTNKTALTTSGGFERPYDIPWQCDVLLPHIRYLQQWQQRFNPVHRKLTRRDLTDMTLRPSAEIKVLPGYYFLFRDPANRFATREQPVSMNRLRLFMMKLLQEVERRLKADGEDIQLVTVGDNIGAGDISSPYSLHGLRATGITYFIESGVPVQVIAEFVAGHSTLLMTLHYAKFGPNYITDALDRAVAAYEQGWEDEYLEQLSSLPQSELASTVAWNTKDGLQVLADSSPGIWAIGIDGICPTGRSMCDKGGERLSSHVNAYYGPVPGGPRNCARCRFFVTGPAFLNGQVIGFNSLVFAISEKVKDLDRVKRDFSEQQAKGSRGRRLERNRTKIDQLEIEIEEMLKTLQARFVLVEKSRALLHASTCESKQHLLTLADQDQLELALESTSYFDLVEFVAQTCELFPEKAEPSARLRKGKILDQFLKRNGYEPLFYALPDDEALAAGNRLTRFLQEKVGRDKVRSLMDGHATLRALGIAPTFEKSAGQIITGKPLRIDAASYTLIEE